MILMLFVLPLAQPALFAQDATGQSTDITELGDVISSPTLSQTVELAPASPALEPGRSIPDVLKPKPSDAAAVTSGTLNLLKQLEAENKNNKTIHATFKQIRKDETFMEEVTSDGELWFRKPDRFRCDYADPEKLINLMVDRDFYMYTPALNQADYWRFESDAERDQQLHQLLIAFGFNTDELLASYIITSSQGDAEPLEELKKENMDPNDKALFIVKPREHFAETSPFVLLKVFVDKKTLRPERLWYQDRNFDASMTLTMKKIDLNEPIKDELFNRNKVFAPGTEIIDKRNTQ